MPSTPRHPDQTKEFDNDLYSETKKLLITTGSKTKTKDQIHLGTQLLLNFSKLKRFKYLCKSESNHFF